MPSSIKTQITCALSSNDDFMYNLKMNITVVIPYRFGCERGAGDDGCIYVILRMFGVVRRVVLMM